MKFAQLRTKNNSAIDEEERNIYRALNRLSDAIEQTVPKEGVILTPQVGYEQIISNGFLLPTQGYVVPFNVPFNCYVKEIKLHMINADGNHAYKLGIYNFQGRPEYITGFTPLTNGIIPLGRVLLEQGQYYFILFIYVTASGSATIAMGRNINYFFPRMGLIQGTGVIPSLLDFSTIIPFSIFPLFTIT